MFYNWTITKNFNDIFEDFYSTFDDIFSLSTDKVNCTSTEDKESIKIELKVPGYGEEDFEIFVDHSKNIICVENIKTKKQEKIKVDKTFSLKNNISLNCKNGILYIDIKKEHDNEKLERINFKNEKN